MKEDEIGGRRQSMRERERERERERDRQTGRQTGGSAYRVLLKLSLSRC